MKRTFLKLPQRPTRYAPAISSRRHRLMEFVSAAYKSHGDDDDDNDDDDDDDDAPAVKEKRALLKKIKGTVKAECETRGYQTKDEIASIINATLKDVNIEALRNFDGGKLQTSVTNIAGELEKVKQMRDASLSPDKRLLALRSLLESKEVMDKIELIFRSKGENLQQVVLSTRAAVASMTTGNVVDDTATPEDILESFSVDAFAKKRRANEYIWDVVNRRTVAEITEYKTWYEEGDEQGAFAIVAEGAIKPLVSKTLVRNVSKYKKLAGKRVYTEEFAKFRKEAYTIIEDLFNDQLLRNYAALIVVDVLAWAASYVGTSLDGKYADPTDYHAIGAVAAQIETLEFIPDTLIINSQDKWRIALEQDKNGQFFMNIPMYAPDGTVRLMGFKVVTSNKIDVGTFALGESRLYKVEDEPVKVRLGYGITVTKNGGGVVTEVESDVDTNRFRIIAETFFHSYIATPYAGSWVYGSFADIKTSLTVVNP